MHTRLLAILYLLFGSPPDAWCSGVESTLEAGRLGAPFALYSCQPVMRSFAIGGAAMTVLLLAWLWTLRHALRERTRRMHADEAKLRVLFDASPEAMWVKDNDGVYRECNAHALQNLGVARADLIGHADDGVFEPQVAAHHRRMGALVRSSGRQQQFRSTLRGSPDGEVRQLDVILVPLFGPTGLVQGTLGIARDVTDELAEAARARAWAHAFEHTTFPLVIIDPLTRRIQEANAAFAELHGYRQEQLTQQPADVLIPPTRVATWRERVSHVYMDSHTVLDTVNVRRNGEAFPVSLDISVTHDCDGNAEQIVVYARDITEAKRAERELLLASAVFEAQTSLMVLSVDGTIERANASLLAFTGYASDELIGQPVTMLDLQTRGNAFRSLLDGRLQPDHPWHGEKWIRRKSGRPRVARVVISAIAGKPEAPVRYLCSLVDLSAEHEARETVERLTFFDPLTALPNRRSLHGELLHALGARHAGHTALFVVDFCGFRHVNERHGFEVGDSVLKLIAKRLQSLVDADATVVRFGGTDFAVLRPLSTEHVDPRGGAERFAQSLHAHLARPFVVDWKVEVSLHAKVGWTLASAGTSTPDQCTQEAEMALYHAKSLATQHVFQFDPAMRNAAAAREAMLDELREAIASQRIDVYFQAQTNREGGIVGAEALVRWTRSDGMPVPPSTFIPLAEAQGLIHLLGHQVLTRCCAVLADWARQPHTAALTLAVNVSAIEFEDKHFADDVLKVVAEAGITPQRLKLEITESSIIHDVERAIAHVNILRAAGIAVSLDDFGTGYSSLSYLARLPVSQLKIDRSFVQGLPGNEQSAVLTRAIINLAHSLGPLQVIAEGVETHAQRQMLAAAGCDGFQGYLFAPALPLTDFEVLLRRRQPLLGSERRNVALPG